MPTRDRTTTVGLVPLHPGSTMTLEKVALVAAFIGIACSSEQAQGPSKATTTGAGGSSAATGSATSGGASGFAGAGASTGAGGSLATGGAGGAGLGGASMAEDGGPAVSGTFYVAPTGAGTACSRVAPCSITQA